MPIPPTDDVAAACDREAIVVRCDVSAKELACILLRVWARDERDPVSDLGIVDCTDDRLDVVLRPRSQNQVAITQLHEKQSRTVAAKGSAQRASCL
jgi:hypothetical protein